MRRDALRTGADDGPRRLEDARTAPLARVAQPCNLVDVDGEGGHDQSRRWSSQAQSSTRARMHRPTGDRSSSRAFRVDVRPPAERRCETADPRVPRPPGGCAEMPRTGRPGSQVKRCGMGEETLTSAWAVGARCGRRGGFRFDPIGVGHDTGPRSVCRRLPARACRGCVRGDQEQDSLADGRLPRKFGEPKRVRRRDSLWLRTRLRRQDSATPPRAT